MNTIISSVRTHQENSRTDGIMIHCLFFRRQATISDFFWFSDEQWARIEPLLPTDTRGMVPVYDRRVLSAIVIALKNGGRWTDCPREIYGPKNTLYNRFVRWAERGVWEDIFSALAGAEELPDRVFIGSTYIKVHRCAGGGKEEPWPRYRRHQRRPQHQAPRRLRWTRPPTRHDADDWKRA